MTEQSARSCASRTPHGGKARGVLGPAEFFEPLRDLLHQAAPGVVVPEGGRTSAKGVGKLSSPDARCRLVSQSRATEKTLGSRSC